MANDTNNINELEYDCDGNSTSMLNSLAFTAERGSVGLNYAETDEDTMDFDRCDDDAAAIDEKPEVALQAEIQSRNESISILQYDFHQLQSRWSGLEKEVRAREELTDRLNEQLYETRQTLARAEVLLSDKDFELAELQSQLHDATAENQQLSTIIDVDKPAKEMDEQRRLAYQEGLIAGNAQEIRELRRQIDRSENYADEIRTKLQDLNISNDLAARQRYHLELSLTDAAGQIHELKEKLGSETRLAAELKKENKQLQRKFAKEIKLLKVELPGAGAAPASRKTLHKKKRKTRVKKAGKKVSKKAGRSRTTRSKTAAAKEKQLDLLNN